MSEPTRFIGSGGLKGKLLASAKQDRPPKGARHRAILAAAAGAAASTKAASATATLSATTLGRWALWKWIAVGALGAGTVVAAKTVVLPQPTPDATSLVAPPSRAANPPVPHARRDPAPAPPPPADSASAEASSLSPPPQAQPVPPSNPAGLASLRPPSAPKPQARAVSPEIAQAASERANVPPSSVAPPSASTLASEISSIDGAKRALASGDATEALRRVDAYDVSFPRGTLAAEATALRIEALAHSGRLVDARAELARFRASHPSSPLLENLAPLVGE